MNHKPGSVTSRSRPPPSVLKNRFRPFFAVYPRFTGGPPARILDFAPDEVCLFRHCCQCRGGLLPRLFTLTLPGGIFSVALSVPITGSRTLSGIMPCGARTFLPEFGHLANPKRQPGSSLTYSSKSIFTFSSSSSSSSYSSSSISSRSERAPVSSVLK